MKRFCCLLLFALIIMEGVIIAFAEENTLPIKNTIPIKFNGKDITLEDDNGEEVFPISYNGQVYVPLKAFMKAIGGTFKFYPSLMIRKNNEVHMGVITLSLPLNTLEASNNTDRVEGTATPVVVKETPTPAIAKDTPTPAVTKETPTSAVGEKTAYVENASYFYNIENYDVMKTNTSRIHGAVMAMLYVAGDDDEICKDFTKTFNEHMKDMKIAIGKWRANFTIIAVAFSNGEFYCFEITHFPIMTSFDDAFIRVTKIKKQSFYDGFDTVLKNMEAQRIETTDKDSSLKFEKISAKDVVKELLEIVENGLK